MSSLRQVLAAHGSVLLLDAASARVQVGWIGNDSHSLGRWASEDDEAGTAVFRGVEKLGVRLDQVGAFVFCHGPGSILGIRTVAMALRTWSVLKPRPVYAYSSLALAAQALNQPELTLIADARRESWHAFKLGGSLQRLRPAELTAPLAMPEHFRTWSNPPAGVVRVPYDVAEHFARVVEADILHEEREPDAFLHEEPTYVSWTPQIHRAP